MCSRMYLRLSYHYLKILFNYEYYFLGEVYAMLSYSQLIKGSIIAALRNSPCTFEEVVRKCHGVYPTEVKQMLDGLNIHSRYTSLYMTQEDLIPFDSDYTIDEEQRSFITYSIENNPVLSCWYYSWQTCNKAFQLDIWRDKSVLFMGTPRLFEFFAGKNTGATCDLIELDEIVCNGLYKRVNSGRSSVYNKDINEITSFNKKYDAVFMDPPWYIDSYKSWLYKAFHYVNSGGTLYISFLPYLTRPTAAMERKELLDFCRLHADVVIPVQDFYEYDMPTFEKNELEHCGIKMLSNWKIADLLIIKEITNTADIPKRYMISQDYKDWEEFELFGTRWFIRTGGCLKDKPEEKPAPLIETAGSSQYLNSPSRRNESLKHFNLLSSKGHGFKVADTAKFIRIVSEIKRKSLTLPIEQAIEGLDIDYYSKQMICKMGE